jgi:hypothetical protein
MSILRVFFAAQDEIPFLWKNNEDNFKKLNLQITSLESEFEVLELVEQRIKEINLFDDDSLNPFFIIQKDKKVPIKYNVDFLNILNICIKIILVLYNDIKNDYLQTLLLKYKNFPNKLITLNDFLVYFDEKINFGFNLVLNKNKNNNIKFRHFLLNNNIDQNKENENYKLENDYILSIVKYQLNLYFNYTLIPYLNKNIHKIYFSTRVQPRLIFETESQFINKNENNTDLNSKNSKLILIEKKYITNLLMFNNENNVSYNHLNDNTNNDNNNNNTNINNNDINNTNNNNTNNNIINDNNNCINNNNYNNYNDNKNNIKNFAIFYKSVRTFYRFLFNLFFE